MREKVAIALSGGVDSAVAAALLLEQGYEVSAITMALWSADKEAADKVCAEAEAVARSLGLKHSILDLRKVFRSTVVEYFLTEYAKGRTPNPCVYCNKKIKFGALYEAALKSGADYLATGHYARILPVRAGQLCVARARHLAKDQSYVLYHLTAEQLAHILFPLGEMTKDEVRQEAQRLSLAVAHSKESQDICFIPDNNHHAFLTTYGRCPDAKGNFVDLEGHVLGQHRGLSHYTVGQRKGLGIAASHPLYVQSLNLERNEVVVGSAEEASFVGALLSDVYWAQGALLDGAEPLSVKIRYNAKPLACHVRALDTGQVRVDFATPIRGVAAGQSAVFYKGEFCVGGGVIIYGQPLAI